MALGMAHESLAASSSTRGGWRRWSAVLGLTVGLTAAPLLAACGSEGEGGDETTTTTTTTSQESTTTTPMTPTPAPGGTEGEEPGGSGAIPGGPTGSGGPEGGSGSIPGGPTGGGGPEGGSGSIPGVGSGGGGPEGGGGCVGDVCVTVPAP
ncbi:hypothetical protein FIV07_02810 [Mycobacterium sp. THAF192]|nr:hypothetical protein FIV07_02810 [Mycobacterium sp. THAF192]